MNIDKFKSTYAESRNGTNDYHCNPLIPRLVYTDGVKELAELGCYWLLDVIGTEFVEAYDKHKATLDYQAFIDVVVTEDDKATINLRRDSGETPVYTWAVPYTDMPAGTWLFYISPEGPKYILILPTEY